MFLRTVLLTPLTLTLAGLGVGRAAEADSLPPRAAHLYRVVRPIEKDLKWKQIPWLLDLEAGIRQAREEKRPLFLWVSGDDPLERC